MKRTAAGLVVLLLAGAAGVADARGHKNVREMSDTQLIDLALSAAPKHVAEDAAVMVAETDGSMRELRPGNNGFTCFPFSEDTLPGPDPICLDGPSMQWASALMSGEPAPTNKEPGVSYMAHGGYHWLKDGKVLMAFEEGAKAVKEPPHWMIMFPFSAETSQLPIMPNKGGTWVMWGDTPYAHLMIYQDPRKMK